MAAESRSDLFTTVQALVVSSQSLPITQASGLSHDSLSASALRSPSVHVAGEARCENEPLSARMLESPSSMPPSQEQSHVETLMVASDGTHDEGVVQVKAEVRAVRFSCDSKILVHQSDRHLSAGHLPTGRSKLCCRCFETCFA